MSGSSRVRVAAVACALLIAFGAVVLWVSDGLAIDAESQLRDQLRRTMSRAHELDLVVRPAQAASRHNASRYLAQVDSLIAHAASGDERNALERVRACMDRGACADGVDAAVLQAKTVYSRPLGLARQALERARHRAQIWRTVGGAALVIGAVLLFGFAWWGRTSPIAVPSDKVQPDERAAESVRGDGDIALSRSPSESPGDDADRASDERPTTRRKRAISFSDVVSAEMEETLRSRLEQLYQAKKRARENERFAAFGEIAAGLSHGLKTPLACVRAAAQVAQAKIGFEHPASENLDDIIDQVDGLVEQIVRFLATMGGGAPALERIRAREIVRALDEHYQRRPGAGGVAWTCVVDERVDDVMAEPELIQMALRNLIDNAYSVAPKGTEVNLSVSPCAAPARAGLDENEPSEALRDAVWIEFAVRDHGPGMPRDVITKERVTSTRPGGSGLGLAIARRIAARHGGRLALDGEVAQGTLARLVLPPVTPEDTPQRTGDDFSQESGERAHQVNTAGKS